MFSIPAGFYRGLVPADSLEILDFAGTERCPGLYREPELDFTG
jgi:hypothetical protein